MTNRTNLFLRRSLTFFLFLFSFSILIAHPRQRLIEVIVTPDRLDWTYQLNEQVNFDVKILMNDQAIPNTKVTYEIGPEQMPAEKKGEMVLKNGQGTIKGGKFSKPNTGLFPNNGRMQMNGYSKS